MGAGKAQGEKGLTNDDYEPNLCCGVLDCFNLSAKWGVVRNEDDEYFTTTVSEGSIQI